MIFFSERHILDQISSTNQVMREQDVARLRRAFETKRTPHMYKHQQTYYFE